MVPPPEHRIAVVYRARQPLVSRTSSLRVSGGGDVLQCATFEVPGIGSITGDCFSSQACDGVASAGWRQRCSGSSGRPAVRREREPAG